MSALIKPVDAAARLPPSDLDAEAMVISACILSADDLALIADKLSPPDFYSDANRRIFEAIGELTKAGTHVDLVSVAGWLRDRERLGQVGGAAYLAQIFDNSPAVAHVEEKAARIVDFARARKLIATAQRIAAEGYGVRGDEVTQYLEDSERAVFEIAQGAEQPRDAASMRVVMQETIQNLMRAEARGQGNVELPTGLVRFDAKIGGLHRGGLTVIAARPGMGKTTLATGIADTIGTLGELVAIFSLEMPREQLGTRMACCRVGANVKSALQGTMTDRERVDFLYAQDALAKAPIFIDDTPAISLTQIRAKARRITSQAGRKIAVIIVDYLQLMTSEAPKGSSREREISSLTAALKRLARELECAVVLLSQLNRECDTRDDKRPRLSDLRECITGDQVVMDAMTGALVTVRQIAAGRPTIVYGLREDWKIAAAPVVRAWSTGTKKVYRLRTRSGRTVRATSNHPFRTIGGWTKLESLRVGERIAVPRILHEPADARDSFSAERLRLLGYLVSDGHYGKHRTISYVKGDPILCADVRSIALKEFGITAKPRSCLGDSEQMDLTGDGDGPGSNPLINWLKDIGIHGQVGQRKRVPAAVFAHTNKALGGFLGALWAGDGSVVARKSGGYVLRFTNTSMGLLDDVQWILSRLGIVHVRGGLERNSKSTVDISSIVVSEADAISRFAEMVVLPGIKGERLSRAIATVAEMGRNARLDRLPLEVTSEVSRQQLASGMSCRELGYRPQGNEMCRADLGRVASKLENAKLTALAESDVLWDEVLSIEPDGEDETFDLSVPGLNNFVVGNVFAHNSGAIEQDADDVIFVYRDEYYREATEHKGTAELIVAKQRNGPTGTVRVGFDGRSTAFRNLHVSDDNE